MSAMWNLVFGSFVDTERYTKKNSCLPKETNTEKFNKYKKTVREKVTFSSKLAYQEPPPEKALAPEPEAPDPHDSQPDDRSKLLQIDELRQSEEQSPIEELVSAKCPADGRKQGLLNELAYEYAMCSPEFNHNILELFCGSMCTGISSDVLRVAHDECFSEINVEPPPPAETNENMESERQNWRKKEKRSTTADVLINDQSCDSINSKHGIQGGDSSCEIVEDGFETELSDLYEILAKHYNDDVF